MKKSKSFNFFSSRYLPLLFFSAFVAIFSYSSCQKEQPAAPEAIDESPIVTAIGIFDDKNKTTVPDTSLMDYRQKLRRSVEWERAYYQQLSDTLVVFAPVNLSEPIYNYLDDSTSIEAHNWIQLMNAEDKWQVKFITMFPDSLGQERFSGLAIINDWYTGIGSYTTLLDGKTVSKERYLSAKSNAKTMLSMGVTCTTSTYYSCVTAGSYTHCNPHTTMDCIYTDDWPMPEEEPGTGGGGSGGGGGNGGDTGSNGYVGEDGVGEKGPASEADPDLPSSCDSWDYQPVSGGTYQACGVQYLRFDYITEYQSGNQLKVEYYRGTFPNVLYFEFPKVRANGTTISKQDAARLTASIKDLAEEILESQVEASPPPANTFESDEMIRRFYRILQSKMAEYGGRVSKVNNYGVSNIKNYSKTITPCY